MHYPNLPQLLLGIAIALTTLPTIHASCYYPDGSFPTDYAYQPCIGTGFTTCCIPSEGDRCMSNGLCQYGLGGYLFRGACTDKDWNSPNCFQHCKTGDGASKWQKVVSCGGNKYCCSNSTVICCNDDSLIFEVADGVVINDYTSLTPTGTVAVMTAPTGVNIHTSNGYIYTSTVTTSTRTSTRTGYPTATASSTVSAIKKNKIPIIAGIAGFVALLLALWIAHCWRRSYKRKQLTKLLVQNQYPPPYVAPSTPGGANATQTPAAPSAAPPAPAWKQDPAKTTPWAATPVPVAVKQPSVTEHQEPEIASYPVQPTGYGAVVYEAPGTAPPTRYEVPGQTRMMYEAPAQERAVYEAPGQTRAVHEAPGHSRPIYEAEAQQRQMYEAP